MRVSLTEHGGYAGLRVPPRTLDSAVLHSDSRAELEKLVIAAQSAEEAKPARSGKARDAISYVITIEDGGKTTLTGADDLMTSDFAALLQWIKTNCPDPAE